MEPLELLKQAHAQELEVADRQTLALRHLLLEALEDREEVRKVLRATVERLAHVLSTVASSRTAPAPAPAPALEADSRFTETLFSDQKAAELAALSEGWEHGSTGRATYVHGFLAGASFARRERRDA